MRGELGQSGGCTRRYCWPRHRTCGAGLAADAGGALPRAAQLGAAAADPLGAVPLPCRAVWGQAEEDMLRARQR